MRTRQVTAVFWLFAASTTLLAGTIAVQPAAPTVALGQTFTLSVNISGAADLYGYQFDLGFNPTVLQAISVTEGAFLGTGGPTIFLPGTIDNVGGSITANADILQWRRVRCKRQRRFARCDVSGTDRRVERRADFQPDRAQFVWAGAD